MPPKVSAAPAVPKKAPPPMEKAEVAEFAANNSGMAAVMNELVSGSVLNLKKVSDDMKTKNRKADDVAAVPISVAPVIANRAVLAAVVHLPPVCEIQRSNWVVENFVNHAGMLKLDDCDMKQIVYVSKCVNTTIFVNCKVKSITLDGCKKVNLIVHSVISSVELVNCERCKIQSINELPSLCIDKCSGVSVTLSPLSLQCEFTTSKSSEMNVSVPIGVDGDYKELAVPEQFVHKIGTNAKNEFVLQTGVSALYHSG